MPAPVSPRGCRLGPCEAAPPRVFNNDVADAFQRASVSGAREVMVSTCRATPISRQGGLGSCVANAICDALEICRAREGSVTQLSRLSLYWFSRALHSAQNVDDGTFVDYGLMQCETVGVIPESEWPYIEANVNVEPSNADIFLASQNRILASYKIGDSRRGDMLELSLRADQSVVYASALDKADYEAPKPGTVIDTPRHIWGWHAQIVVGFRILANGSRIFCIRNSWGEDWGEDGFIWVTEAYLNSQIYANSFRAITRMPELVLLRIVGRGPSPRESPTFFFGLAPASGWGGATIS